MPDRPVNTPFPDSPASRTEPLSEIQEDLIMRHQRQHLFPRAALVGLGAGLIAALFRGVLASADALRNALLTWSHQFPPPVGLDFSLRLQHDRGTIIGHARHARCTGNAWQRYPSFKKPCCTVCEP